MISFWNSVNNCLLILLCGIIFMSCELVWRRDEARIRKEIWLQLIRNAQKKWIAKRLGLRIVCKVRTPISKRWSRIVLNDWWIKQEVSPYAIARSNNRVSSLISSSISSEFTLDMSWYRFTNGYNLLWTFPFIIFILFLNLFLIPIVCYSLMVSNAWLLAKDSIMSCDHLSSSSSCFLFHFLLSFLHYLLFICLFGIQWLLFDWSNDWHIDEQISSSASFGIDYDYCSKLLNGILFYFCSLVFRI